MTTQEMIEVLTAFQNGEEIEYRCYGCGFWEKCEQPLWNFTAYKYRVKPEITARKFKLIKTYPFSPSLGKILEFRTEKDFNDGVENVGEGSSTYYLTDCVDFPEYWEEIIEEKHKEYVDLVGKKCMHKSGGFSYVISAQGTEFLQLLNENIGNELMISYNNFNKYYELC